MSKSTPYLALQNFRFGLDARRSELTSQPGTLMRAVDCHINQGAEIEKRKAFIETVLPQQTFGLLPTPNGLMTFGSQPQSSLVLATVAITLWNVSGSGNTYIICPGTVPPHVIVGSSVKITGTGGVLDNTVTTIISIIQNVGAFELFLSFNSANTSGSGGTCTFPITLSPLFLYQQLTDPNVGYTLYQVTQIQNPAKFSIPINGYQFNFSNGTYLSIPILNPGIKVGDIVSVAGTGTPMDGNTYTVVNLDGPLLIEVNYFESGGDFIPCTGTLTGSLSNSVGIYVTGALPAGFSTNSTFSLSGITDPSIAFLNGPQTVNTVYYDGTYSYISVLASYVGTVGTLGGASIGLLALGSTSGGTMLSVIAACLFNGKPFVVATFEGDSPSNPDIGIFYNGIQVNDFFNGEVFSNATSNGDLATQLTNYINATAGYIATVNGAEVTCTSVNPTDSTKATTGGNFTVAFANQTSNGVLVQAERNSAVPATAGEDATASFQIIAGNAGTGTAANISGIYISSAINTNLLSSSVPWDTTGATFAAQLTNTVAAVVTNLNINAGKQIASANGNTITIDIGAAGSQGNDASLLVIVAPSSNNDGAVCIDNCMLFIDVGAAKGSDYLSITKIVTSLAPSTNLLSATVTQTSGQTSLQYATSVAININANTGANGGFLACPIPAIGNSTEAVIFLTRSSCFSANISCTVTPTWTANSGNGAIGIAVTNANFNVTLSKSSVSSPTNGTSLLANVPTLSVTAKPIGGVGPFTYLWQNVGGSNLVVAGAPNKPSTAFVSTSAVYGYVVGYDVATFICVVTDTGNLNIQATSPALKVSASHH